MKTQQIPIDTFAGLDLDTQPLRAARDGIGRLTASTCQNCYLDPVSGEVVKMPGSSVWNSTACTGGPPIRMIPYRHASGKMSWFARTASGYYRRDDSGTGWSAAYFATSGQFLQVPSFAQVGNTLVICDGENALSWDGSASTFSSTRGLPPPIAGQVQGANRPSLTLATPGTLTAFRTYAVWMTFVSAGGESAPLQAGSIQVVDSTNDAIKLWTGYSGCAAATADGISGSGYGLMVLPSGTTNINVYIRDTTANATLFRFTQVAPNAVGAGYELTATITSLPATNPMTTYSGPPAGCNIVCEYAGRAMYTASPCWPNRVWASEAGEPLTVKGYSWFDAGRMDDPIISAVTLPLENPLFVILKRSSVWTQAGYDDASFVTGLRAADNERGCLLPHAVIVRGRMCYFIGSAGAFSFDGSVVQAIDKGVRTEIQATLKGAA